MSVEVRCGDALELLCQVASGEARMCLTSPPYWGLRDYGVAGQIGLERTPQEYVEKLVVMFRELRRVLAKDGTLWLNLGDSYNAYNGGAGPSSSISAGASTTQRPSLPTGFGLRARRLGSTRADGMLAEDSPRFRDGVSDVALKPKDLIGIPWRVAFALQADGWWLRSDIIWLKPNPMPESVTDRPTKAHEYLFLLSKSARYFYDADAIAEPGSYLGPNGAQKSPYAQGFSRRTPAQEKERRQVLRDKQRGHGRRHAGFNERWDQMEKEGQCSVMRNARSVWTIATEPFPEAHFATFPTKLARRCILAGSKRGDLVIDPFCGSGTTGLVADRLGRNFLGFDLNADYCEMARRRIHDDAPLLSGVRLVSRCAQEVLAL